LTISSISEIVHKGFNQLSFSLGHHAGQFYVSTWKKLI